MDVIQYVRAVRRRWPAVVVLAAMGLATAAVTLPSSKSAEPEGRGYVATHILLVDLERDPFAQSPPPSNPQLDQYALRAQVGEVPARAAKALGFRGTPTEFAEKYTVATASAVGTLSITGRAARQSQAEAIANTVAAELLVELKGRAQDAYGASLRAAEARRDELEKQVAAVSRELGAKPDSLLLDIQARSLENQYGGATLDVARLRAEGPPDAGFSTVQTAVAVPAGGVSTPAKQSLHLLAGAVIGTLLGIALALALDRLDPRIWTREAAEAAYGLPVIAEIPKLRRGQSPLAAADEAPHVTEAYRMLRASVLLGGTASLLRAAPHDGSEPNGTNPASRTNGKGHPTRLRTVLVTSALPGEGKTTVVANLGAVLAESGPSVIALDVNFRQPHLHDVVGEPRAPGITDIVDDVSGKSVGASRLRVVLRPTVVPHLSVATSGAPVQNPAAELAPVRSVVVAASELAEVVVVDTPSLLVVSDARELIPAVDAVVLVCRAGKTPTRAAVRATEQLARSGAALLGVVLVGTSTGLRGARRQRAYGTRSASAEPGEAEPTTVEAAGTEKAPASTEA